MKVHAATLAQVMRLEAKLAEGITVAKHALKILWDVAAQLDSFGLTRRRTMKRPGEDAVIVRHLIKAITGQALDPSC